MAANMAEWARSGTVKLSWGPGGGGTDDLPGRRLVRAQTPLKTAWVGQRINSDGLWQSLPVDGRRFPHHVFEHPVEMCQGLKPYFVGNFTDCLLYTSDAADERSSVDL